MCLSLLLFFSFFLPFFPLFSDLLFFFILVGGQAGFAFLSLLVFPLGRWVGFLAFSFS